MIPGVCYASCAIWNILQWSISCTVCALCVLLFSSCKHLHAILRQAILCQVTPHLSRHGIQTHATKLAGVLLLPFSLACARNLHLCTLELTLQSSAKLSFKLLAQIPRLGKLFKCCCSNNVNRQHCAYSRELSASVLIDIEAGLFAADHKPDQESGTRCERSYCQARSSGGAESALPSCLSAAAAARHQESGRAQCRKRPRQFSCKLPMLPECWALALVHAVLFCECELAFLTVKQACMQKPHSHLIACLQITSLCKEEHTAVQAPLCRGPPSIVTSVAL